MELAYTPGDNAGYVEDDSDLDFSDCNDDGKSSSEDEKEEFSFGGAPVIKCDSEDDFEQEMEKDLQSKMMLLVSPTVARVVLKTEPPIAKPEEASSVQTETGAKPPDQYYDDVYFDSDSDNEGASGGKKVSKLTNDELFYDPGMDDRDERWVNRQRLAYHNVKVSKALEQKKKAKDSWAKSDEGSSQEDEASSSKTETVLPPVPKSDAVLNCPACMTTLSLDCQRHDVYVNQYRAMFVLNCLIIREETLSYKPKPSKKSRKRRRSKEQVSTCTEEEPGRYNPVRCSECNTEVAVYDQDEVFHFFNVLASAPT